jgi:hypothetical protein
MFKKGICIFKANFRSNFRDFSESCFMMMTETPIKPSETEWTASEAIKTTMDGGDEIDRLARNRKTECRRQAANRDGRVYAS